MQVNHESAEKVCDEKITKWLADRKKHAAHKRKKRTRSSVSALPPAPPWIMKMNARKSPMKECNTPKRSTNSLRRGRSTGTIEPNDFSPLAPSMTRKPVKVKKKIKPQVLALSRLFACFSDCHSLACLLASCFLCRTSKLFLGKTTKLY